MRKNKDMASRKEEIASGQSQERAKTSNQTTNRKKKNKNKMNQGE